MRPGAWSRHHGDLLSETKGMEQAPWRLLSETKGMEQAPWRLLSETKDMKQAPWRPAE